MGRLRTGAVELGLTLEWSFAFIKPGSRVERRSRRCAAVVHEANHFASGCWA